MLHLRTMVVAAFLSGVLPCFAMQVIFEPLDQVLPRAAVVVVADVQRVTPQPDSALWRSLTLQVAPVRTILGAEVQARALTCRYEQGLPHRRGDKTVSPRVSGSGMEFQVTPGRQVILLLASALVDADDCRVLRIEPLASEPAIRAATQR